MNQELQEVLDICAEESDQLALRQGLDYVDQEKGLAQAIQAAFAKFGTDVHDDAAIAGFTTAIMFTANMVREIPMLGDLLGNKCAEMQYALFRARAGNLTPEQKAEVETIESIFAMPAVGEEGGESKDA